MNNNEVAKGLKVIAKAIQADSDYIYDPKHQNRPHGGGDWHKTERGWSRKNIKKNPHKDTSEEEWEDPIEKSIKNPNATPEELHDALDFMEVHDSFDSYYRVLQNDNVSSKDVDWVAKKYMEHNNDHDDLEMMPYLKNNAMAVINHPNVTLDTLKKLTGAQDQEVAREAKRALKTKVFNNPKY